MVYVDKPKPSKFLVSLYIFVLGAIFLLFLFISEERGFYSLFGARFNFGYLFIFYPPFVLLLGMVIHAAYDTEYRIENGKLWMRLGYLSKGSVSLDEVKGVEKVESIPGVVFRKYSPNNYCNRFRKGIRIITEKRVIWVSPEDIERFISELGFTGR